MRPSVVVMPGDGIGPLVIAEALRVLQAAGFEADYHQAEVGWSCWKRDGVALPERTLELMVRHRVGLFGAITSKPQDLAQKELSTEHRHRELQYESPVLALRRQLKLDVAIRPCRSFPGLEHLNHRRINGRGDVELAVVMQNSEGLYSGLEFRGLSASLRHELNQHPRMDAFEGIPNEELAASVRLLSRSSCARVARVAFELAAQLSYQRVICCDKWGVMPETGGLLREACLAASVDHPATKLEFSNVDTHLLRMIRHPGTRCVVLCSALIGDILSDGYAALTGGLGLAPCANLGDDIALFEPVHGSAPHYADCDPPIVNPIAAIRAAGLMVEHLGFSEIAERIERAVEQVLVEGPATFDLLGLAGADDPLNNGACTTHALTDEIIDVLKRRR